MIRRIDHWIGNHLFHPPIIWLCQRTGMTQFAVARYGWMLAAWTLIMRISFEGVGDWIFSALIILVTLIETWRAAVIPNAPTRRSDGLRIIILLFAAFDEIERRHPDLPVLLTSGYTAHHLLPADVTQARPLLHKPYTLAELAAALHGARTGWPLSHNSKREPA